MKGISLVNLVRTYGIRLSTDQDRVNTILTLATVLGPLLFILFINDLPDCLVSRVKIFADDLKLIANLADKTVIDNDLKSLEDWERKWLLEFNSDIKCKVLHEELNDNEHLDYVFNGKNLKKTEQEKDLGVLTSGTLLWNDQIESCISKAYQMLCWISRNLISREKFLMLRVYRTLIRRSDCGLIQTTSRILCSALESCSRAWKLVFNTED